MNHTFPKNAVQYFLALQRCLLFITPEREITGRINVCFPPRAIDVVVLDRCRGCGRAHRRPR